MKRLFLCLFILLIIISACGNSEDEVESKVATTMAETLAANPTDTPIPDGVIIIPDVIGMEKGDAYEILEKLGKNYTAKTIGFTIFIKKWRKKVR